MMYNNIHYKPCTCSGCPGMMWFSEVQDFCAGADNEWPMSYHWCCDTCKEVVYDCEDKFEFPEDR